eukprot:SAG31_NODE_325_length_17671_cov_9.902743_22_plen_248_part_00
MYQSYLFTTEAEPVFDVKNTPTNLGAIPEAFRQRDGVLRSLHPTHSVACFGPKASELVHVSQGLIRNEFGLNGVNLGLIGQGHEDDRSPVGANSPFRKVRDMGGQVAFLGCPCGARCNTSCHGIEELLEVPPPYLFKESKISYTVIDANGASTTQEQHSRHDFDGTGQRYERVLDLLTLGSERSQGKVGGATMHVLDAQAMWANTLAALRADPLSLVQPIEPGAENHWIKKGSSGGIRYHVGASAPE